MRFIDVGASLMGVILMVLVTPPLVSAPTPSELASVTVQLTVLLPAVIVGSSLVELKVIERRAVWNFL